MAYTNHHNKLNRIKNMIKDIVLIPFAIVLFVILMLTELINLGPYNSGLCYKYPFFHKWVITKKKGYDTHFHNWEDYAGFWTFEVKCKNCHTRSDIELHIETKDYLKLRKGDELNTKGRYIYKQQRVK